MELQFITWEMLKSIGTLAAIVFMVVEFTKEITYIKDIKTKYYSFFIALILILIANFQGETFELINIVLYALSAIAISLTANGISDFNHPVDKTKKE
jgi:hypothetical protein